MARTGLRNDADVPPSPRWVEGWRRAPKVRYPDPQILPPKTKGRAMLVVEPGSADAKQEDDTAEFALTAFVEPRMIGGGNSKVTKR